MTPASNRRLRLAYLVAGYLSFLMAVVRTPFAGDNRPVDFLFGTALAVMVTMTCVFDGAVLNRPWAMGVRFPFLIVWPIALPLYIIRSRGWWGCALLLIHAVALFFVVAVIAIITFVMQGVGR
ncbi:MAG: hypothetical protein HY290_33205 [Planctomycetia bacterium]|nr:hypothetical protein [Planctomycetia bacterium]